jgi:hypothetical protein
MAPSISGPYSVRNLSTGYVKGQVYQSPLPQSLRQRISQAIDSVDKSQLWRTWEEFEYRVDIFPVTNGAHIDHLEKMHPVVYHYVVLLYGCQHNNL